jgi:HSP20 family protein
MAIVRWDPFKLMRWPDMWEEEDFMPSGGVRDDLDVYETKDDVVVRAHVAGVPEDKVDITFEKGVLWIRAEAQEEEKEGKKYYRRATRSYSYKVAVPGDIDMRKEPNAQIEDGLVTVTFKKAEQAKPKKIAVRRKAAK